MWAEYDGEVFFVVDVVLIEVQEHFGARDGRDARADDAIDFREDFEECGGML